MTSPDKDHQPFTPRERDVVVFLDLRAQWVSLALVDSRDPRAEPGAGPSNDTGADGEGRGGRVVMGGRRER